MAMLTQRFTRQDINKIRRQCSNVGNWSDGGHWIGRRKAPNCSASYFSRSTSVLTVSWPTIESVERWNINKSVESRRVGYIVDGMIGLVSIFTGVGSASLVASINNKYVSTLITWLAGIAFGITKGETLASGSVIVPRPGYEMKIEMQFELREFAQYLKKSDFIVSLRRVTTDKEGKVVNKYTDIEPVKTKLSSTEISMDFAELLATMKPKNRKVIY